MKAPLSKIIALAVLAVVGAVVAGCGNNGGANAPTTPVKGDKAPVTNTLPQGK